jgi:hypothetical protein
LTDEVLLRPGPRCGILSLFILMCVKEIFKQGKDYPFYRPEHCGRCGNAKVWGHGFVPLWIDGCHEALWFRRWRCPACGCVHTIRPLGYWARHHAPMHVIITGLSHRLKYGFWLKTLGPSRQRQGHWLRALRKNIKARLGMDFTDDPVAGYRELVVSGFVPVARPG